MKTILDTNVIISSIISKNSYPAKSVKKAMKNTKVFSSEALFSELETKILAKKFDKYHPKELRIRLLKNLREILNFSNPKNHVQVCRDPKDNMILDLATTEKIDIIITGDNDLLDLVAIETTIILSPKEFVDLGD